MVKSYLISYEGEFAILEELKTQAKTMVILLICFAATGCSRGIKESIYAVKGSSGKTVLIKGDSDQLGILAFQYGSFQVEPFNNDVGDICPQEFLDELPFAIKKQLSYRSRSFKDRLKGKEKGELGPFFTGPTDKTLLIKGTIIQYETADALGKAAGPMDQAICRVQIYDADTNTLLADANCTGRSKSSVRTGPEELAKGVGRAIKKLLKPNK